jgi:hypothetical protein
MKADLSLLRAVTEEAYAEEPLEAPYVARFELGPKRLTFVATNHETGPETASARTVARAFEDDEPRMLVVESFDARPATGKKYRAHVLTLAEKGCADCEESEYAACLAYRRGIPVLGGEPTDRQILKELLRQKYSVEDFLGFYTARQIPIWRRLGQLEQFTLERLTDHFLEYVRKESGVETPFEYPDFLRWFGAHEVQRRSAADLTVDDTAPYGGPETNYFQRIAFAADRRRETAIVGHIESALDRRDRVIVVYGSGHLVKQRKIWEKMFGAPKSSKYF